MSPPKCHPQVSLVPGGTVSALASGSASSAYWSTSGAVTSAFTFEGPFFLEASATSGTVAVYGCQAGTANGADHFISLKSNCEGKTILRTEGWIHQANASYAPLYRCRWDAAHDHFLSALKDCEKASGAVNEGLIRYAAMS